MDFDHAGNIIIGGVEGIALFNPKTESFVRLHPKVVGGNSPGFVKSIRTDKMGRIWIANTSGLSMLDQQKDSLIHVFGNPMREGTTSFFSISIDSTTGNLWGTMRIPTRGSGIWMYDDTKKKVFLSFKREIPHLHDQKYATVSNVIFDNSDNSLWISFGAEGYIEKLYLETGKKDQFHLKNNNQFNVNNTINVSIGKTALDKQGNLWANLSTGQLIKLNKKLNVLQYLVSQPSDTYGYWGERKRKLSFDLPLTIIDDLCWSASDFAINYFHNLLLLL